MNSSKQHIVRCRNNPNKIETTFNRPEFQRKFAGNQYTKARQLGLSDPVISTETRLKMSAANKGRKHSQDYKDNLSKIAIDRGLGGVRQSKRIKYKDKILGSSYELKVAISLDENNVKWNTCERFLYVDPFGKKRTYTPDFYLLEYDVYLDPKNDFLIEKINPALGFNDLEKIKLVEEQHNIKILVLNDKQLDWFEIKKLAGIP